MANTEEKVYTQFFPDSMSEDIIKAGKLSTLVNETAFKGKSCAYYFYHSEENNGHALNLYILPTDYKNAEGVQCTLHMTSNMPLPGMALLAGRLAENDMPYISKHPHLGDICVLPRLHIREKLWKLRTELLELDSASQSEEKIDTYFNRMTLMCTWIFSCMNNAIFRWQIPPQEEEGRYANELTPEDKTRLVAESGLWDDNNDAPEFIAEMLQTTDEGKRKCFEEFKKLFSLSSLYVEYQICKSLKQQGKHVLAECTLCNRMHRKENSREIESVFSQYKDSTEDVLLKIELLLDLKAIGYNVHGTRLMINKKVYAKSKNIMPLTENHIPIFIAIAAGEVSWIQALIAVGINLKEFNDNALVKFTLTRAPRSEQHAILNILIANGVVLSQSTKSLLIEQANDATQFNNHAFLKWTIDMGAKPDLMSLIDVAAGLSHHKSLKVGEF